MTSAEIERLRDALRERGLVIGGIEIPRRAKPEARTIEFWSGLARK